MVHRVPNSIKKYSKTSTAPFGIYMLPNTNSRVIWIYFPNFVALSIPHKENQFIITNKY